MRSVLRPRWLAGHVGVVGLCIAFLLLGRWQWNESQAPGGDLQNLAYAIQWWLFIAVAIAWWTKLVRDELRSAAAEPTPATGVTATAEGGLGAAELAALEDRAGQDDPEVAEWNDWLAYLNAHPR